MRRNLSAKIIVITLIVLLVATVVGMIYWQIKGDGDTHKSKDVEQVILEEGYVLQGDRIYLSAPEVIYKNGSSSVLEEYAAYVNGKECTVEAGYITMPKNFDDETCSLRLEWERKGNESFYETTISLKKEKAEAFDSVKSELLRQYGEAKKEVGSSSIESELRNLDTDYGAYDDREYTYYLSPGVMEFCEIDMDKDGSNELLCMRQTEEMGFDCMVYDQTENGVERIYSLEENDEVIPERYGGIAVRDGEIPHFVYLNRMTPMCMYYMESNQIVKYDFRDAYENSDGVSADIYGYMYQDYDDFIGKEENYDEIMLIYCELFYLRQEIE